jgi:parallel beta-helix repeat protein
MPALFSNNAAARLAQDITPWDTTIRLEDGSNFPQPAAAGKEHFQATLVATDATEIVRVTARDGNTLTVVRGREGTEANEFAAGDAIELRLTADSLNRFIQEEAVDAANASVLKNTHYVAADPFITDHGDPATSGSLAAILATVGSARAHVELPAGHTYLVCTDLTIPSTVTLSARHGAVVRVLANKTVTINGVLSAGPYRIFDGDGSVTGTFAGQSVYPQWWGAVGDGTTDDTLALNRALACTRIRMPAGTYLISSTLELPDGTSLKGEAPDCGYIDWTNDHTKATPSYAGKVAVIQYRENVHGALFSGANNCSFRDMVFRCGQSRNTSDAFFAVPGSHIHLDNCKFENLDNLMSGTNAAYGGIKASGCRFFACGWAFVGSLTDCVFTANTFTSCGKALEFGEGSGFNIVQSNRFEWCDEAVFIYRGRSNTISNNVIDAANHCGLKMQDASNTTVTGNVFWRNGRKAENEESRSHILLKGDCLSNRIVSNVFLKGGPDSGGQDLWPQYIVEILSGANAANTFLGNDTSSACVSMPFNAPYWNSTDSLLVDSVHIKDLGAPGASNDNFMEILKRIAHVAAAPVEVVVYENRKFTAFTDLRPGRIRIRGVGDPVLEDTASGRAHSLLGVENATYGQAFGPPVQLTTAPGPPAAGYWKQGAVVWNSAPESGQPMGWVCVQEGPPGTWKSFASIS